MSAEQNETQMRERFEGQVSDILNSSERFEKQDSSIKCGLELEYGIVAEDEKKEVNESIRNDVMADCEGFSDCELGATQLEMRTEPLDLKEGTDKLLDQIIEREEAMIRSVNNKGVFLLRHGSNPFVALNAIVRTDNSKYRLVPNFHNTNRRKSLNTMMGQKEQVDAGDAAIIALTNSVQANIEAKNFNDAIDMVNRSFAIGPMVVSLFGNARFFENKDTGLNDARMIGWELSHDTRTSEELKRGEVTRIGLLNRYYKDMPDYFNEVGKYPFILNAPENAINVALGLNWRDARIKIMNDDLVVEFRPVSTQSTPEESFAAMMFYLGRLLWSKDNKEELMPLNMLKENREAAMKDGLNTSLWIDFNGGFEQASAREVLREEIDRAARGLERNGLYDQTIKDVIDLLHARNAGESAIEVIVKLREGYLSRGLDARTSMFYALQDVDAIK